MVQYAYNQQLTAGCQSTSLNTIETEQGSTVMNLMPMLMTSLSRKSCMFPTHMKRCIFTINNLIIGVFDRHTS